MSQEMDGLGLLRTGGDHQHNNHEESSRLSSSASVVEEENSNASSGSNENEERGVIASRENAEETDDGVEGVNPISAKESRRSVGTNVFHGSLASSTSTTTTSSNNSNLQRHASHHHTLPRANNYCQFETPADESRGTFPDDLDEELFINMHSGGRSEDPAQFDGDEENRENVMDVVENDNKVDNPNDSGLNFDTADHSESSDIEEMFSIVVSQRPADLNSTTPTSSRKRFVAGRSLERCGRVLVSLSSCVYAGVGGPSASESLNNQEDLNNGGNSNKELMEACVQNQCRLVDESYNQDDTTDEDCPQPETEVNGEPSNPTSFSTVIRKRKFFTDDSLVTLPTKKASTEVIDDAEKYSGLLPESETPDSVVCEIDEEMSDDAVSLPPSPDTPADMNPALTDWLNVFASWNTAERLTAVNHLIQASEPSEVRHMMRIIEPQFQRDFISLLPKELALYVLSFLEPKDLLGAAQTCRYWRILCDDSLLWKEKCREAGIGPFSAMSQRIHNRKGKGSAGAILGLLGAARMCPGAADSNCISSCEPWKAAFLRQHNVEMNWRFQPIRPAKTLKGHDDHVITCLQFSGNRIVSGSDDNTLKVWSATTGKCLRTLVGHTGGVWSSQMSGSTIVSGSTDRTLRVWDADTGACLHTLYGHTSTVRCMHLFERKVVSGSRDATLRVWNVDNGECLHVLVGHLAAVRCVQYNGRIVVSGAYDFMVRVWDVEREECLHQLSGHTNRVYSLQFDGIHVVSGSLDTSIRVWDVQTGTCKHTLMGHQSLTSGMELRDNLLVSGNADSTVKIWDINTGQCLLTLSGANKHLSAVTCLQLINKFVITSSDDGTVKLWDIATGEFVRNLVTLSSGGSGGVVWRIRASETKLVCAVGSRNGTEETKLLVLDFDVDSPKYEEGMKDASTSTDLAIPSVPTVPTSSCDL